VSGLHSARRGAGPPVVCLHAGAGSHLQWLPHFHRFASRYTCIAPDLHGHGASPQPAGVTAETAVERQVEALARLLETLDAPAHLVGHSYGAAMALATALAHPTRVASLLLVEPPLFRLLAAPEDAPLLAEVEHVELAARMALNAGDPLRASEIFSTYWSGAALWGALPDVFRRALADGAASRHRVGIAAMFGLEVPVDVGARLDDRPVTLLGGAQSPAPARRILRRLAGRLPEAESVVVEGAGHMLPSTHVAVFQAVLGAHLERASRARSETQAAAR
jgi:pimeloyl-ACP methyl ester carboxylesterase